jgi:4-amino-4-deoxy-L-arabinose transferase-like glycosyltransferase
MGSIALEKTGGRRYLEGFLLGLLGLLILCIIILALVPPVAKDALIHHLAVPKLYLKHGGMYEIPFMPFSYYPMNLEMLYLIPLYFGNDIIPKLIHFSFALLTALLIFRYLNKRTRPTYALFGVLFFLSIPIIIKLSTTAYVDLGLLFFSFASLYFLMEWMQRPSKKISLVLSGVMSGLAMGTKYNGLITFLLVALFVPFLYSRVMENQKRLFLKSAIHGLSFVFIGLLVFSPWMARDYSWKKNPIYPLYEHKFNPQKSRDSGEDQGRNGSINGGLGVFVIRAGIYHEPWWEIALVPIRIFLEGRDGSPKYFDGKLNPFLLFLSVFAFWRIREEEEEVRKEKKVMLAFVVLFFTIAFFASDLRIRYIAPLIPVLVVLSVMGAEKLHIEIGKVNNAKRKHIFFAVLVLALASALAYNGQYVVDQFKEVEPLEYIAGKISRDEYLNRHRPEYGAMSFINHYLPQDAKVMLIFLGSRGYYCDRSYVYGDEALGPVFLGSGNAEEMYSKLKSMGITHLLIYDRLFGRWVRNNLKDRAEKTLKSFFLNYVKIVYSQNGFSVFALKSSFS